MEIFDWRLSIFDWRNSFGAESYHWINSGCSTRGQPGGKTATREKKKNGTTHLLHSVLNAAMGLILVARRAGSQVASKAAAIRTAGAIVKAKGSVALTWKSTALTTFPVASASRKPKP